MFNIETSLTGAAMDKHLNDPNQKMLLSALSTAKDARRKMEEREEEKRWPNVEQLSLTLAGSLANLTKNELDTIRLNLDIRGVSKLKKQELIVALAQLIPEALPPILNLLDDTRYQILRRVADRGGRAEQALESNQIDYFRDRGLMFPVLYKGKQTLIMHQKVIEVFKSHNSADYRELVQRNSEAIKLTQGLLFHYGTLSLDQLDHFLQQYMEKTIGLGEHIDILFESLTFYNEIKLDSHGFSNSRVWDSERVKEEHALRLTVPYYPFTKAELLQAGEPGYMDRHPSYRGFVQYIRKYYDLSQEMADSQVEECVYAIYNGETPGDILSYLQNVFQIEEMPEIMGFMKHIEELYNQTRQWFLKGHTPTGMSANRVASGHPAKPVPSAASTGEVIDFATRQKVGRNDPCPCGSGKKFKKCCG
jgi:hypothetical protein